VGRTLLLVLCAVLCWVAAEDLQEPQSAVDTSGQSGSYWGQVWGRPCKYKTHTGTQSARGRADTSLLLTRAAKVAATEPSLGVTLQVQPTPAHIQQLEDALQTQVCC
jgi:hypothetical protein